MISFNYADGCDAISMPTTDQMTNNAAESVLKNSPTVDALTEMVAASVGATTAPAPKTATTNAASEGVATHVATGNVAAGNASGNVVVGAVVSGSTAVPRARVRSKPPTPAKPQYSLALDRLARGEAIIDAEGNKTRAYRVLKRIADLCGALCVLVLAAPIMLGTLLILTVTTRGKPIFTQQRVGYLGRRFKMYKFRTMRLDADKLQHLVVNEKDGPVFKNRRDPRITRIGRILRKTSIDELPQLFNVLKGDMALVGPRPPVVKEVANYAAWQRRRLAVMPGLTCLWQVSGRCEVGFEDWVRMDIWYGRHQSFWTDVKLLIKTPLKILTGRGAY